MGAIPHIFSHGVSLLWRRIRDDALHRCSGYEIRLDVLRTVKQYDRNCRYVPSPIAANSAILVGYSTAGISGAILSAVAILLPSAILVLTVSFYLCFFR